jgi:hypothetical protein
MWSKIVYALVLSAIAILLFGLATIHAFGDAAAELANGIAHMFTSAAHDQGGQSNAPPTTTTRR